PGVTRHGVPAPRIRHGYPHRGLAGSGGRAAAPRPGSTLRNMASGAVGTDAGWRREIEQKVYSGERLSRADGEALYACDDLSWLGGLAHHRRTELNGDRV